METKSLDTSASSPTPVEREYYDSEGNLYTSAPSPPRLAQEGYYDSKGNLYFKYYCNGCGAGMGQPFSCGNCNGKSHYYNEKNDVFSKIEINKEVIIIKDDETGLVDDPVPLSLSRSEPSWRIDSETNVFSWKHPCVCGRNGLTSIFEFQCSDCKSDNNNKHKDDDERK